MAEIAPRSLRFDIAIELRPALVSTALFVALAVIPWRTHGPDEVAAAVIEAGTSALDELGPQVIESPVTPQRLTLDRLLLPPTVAIPNLGDPAARAFPDAQDWPRGMVIHPHAHPDDNNLHPGATRLDRLLSVLFGALHALDA